MYTQIGKWMLLFAMAAVGCGGSQANGPSISRTVGSGMPSLGKGALRVRVERKGGKVLLIPERSCSKGFCDGPEWNLGKATGFPKFTLVDLAGEPGPLPKANETLQLSANAVFPAALVYVENAREHRRDTVMHLLDLRAAQPKHIWRYTASSRDFREKGRGVEMESAQMLANDNDGPLHIEVRGIRRRHVRGGVPAKGEMPFVVRFRYTDGGEYRRMQRR